MSTVYFKRQGGGTSSPTVAKAPTSLAYGEPAIDSTGVIYVGNGKGEVVSKVKHADNGLWLYSGVYKVDGWTANSDGTHRQSVAVTPVDGGTALVAGANLGPVMTAKTTDLNTNKTLSEALSIINMGSCVAEDAAVAITVAEKPDCDITCYWYVR
nr:MAG TPA: hypothetical protein [Caudoviricetes sp.]